MPDYDNGIPYNMGVRGNLIRVRQRGENEPVFFSPALGGLIDPQQCGAAHRADLPPHHVPSQMAAMAAAANPASPTMTVP